MSLYASDKKSALLGFTVGGLIILVVLFGMVQWTNAQFDAHEPSAAATH